MADKSLEDRVSALESRLDEFDTAATSGDPLGAFQRLSTGRKARLAEVQNPAKLTDAKIQEISGDDGSDDPENAANRDVAEGLKEARTEAKNPAKAKAKGARNQPGPGGAR